MIAFATLPVPLGVSPVVGATLPEHSNDGYVAAAYIVFLALVLIYVVIMAIRLGRVQRKVEELRRDPDAGGLARARESAAGEGPNPQASSTRPQASSQEHETV